MEQIRWEIDAIPFDQTTICVRFWWEASMNTSQVWGINRSEDADIPISAVVKDWPDRNFAISKIGGPFTNRAQSDANRYARAIAWWMGKDSVDIETYTASAIATLNHRLMFDATYEADCRTHERDTDMQTYLTKHLLEDMSKDYNMREKNFLRNIVGKIVRPDFDPHIREGDKGFDKDCHLDDRDWDQLETRQHPVMHAARSELRKVYGIDIQHPHMKTFESEEEDPPESDE